MGPTRVFVQPLFRRKRVKSERVKSEKHFYAALKVLHLYSHFSIEKVWKVNTLFYGTQSSTLMQLLFHKEEQKNKLTSFAVLQKIISNGVGSTCSLIEKDRLQNQFSPVKHQCAQVWMWSQYLALSFKMDAMGPLYNEFNLLMSHPPLHFNEIAPPLLGWSYIHKNTFFFLLDLTTYWPPTPLKNVYTKKIKIKKNPLNWGPLVSTWKSPYGLLGPFGRGPL